MSKYYYSDNVGLKIIPDNVAEYADIASDTEDEAMLMYYLDNRKRLLSVIRIHENRVLNESKKLDSLNQKFEYLSEKFPEEFL